jgi:hypothetical protein
MAAAAGYMLNVHHIRPGLRPRNDEVETRVGPVAPETPAAAVIAKQPRFQRFAKMAAKLNGNDNL